jgi:hypothetical protein
MPRRIIESGLYAAVRRLNDTAGMPHEPNERGAYYLQGAYGGWQLQRTRIDGRGCESVTSGYVSKPMLYDLVHAVITGYENAKRDRHLAVFGSASLDTAPIG